MASPVVLGVQQTNLDSMSTSHNVGQGTPIDAGDLLVAIFVGSQVGADEAYTITDPSGYTFKAENQYNVAGENRQNTGVYVKEAAGTEDGLNISIPTSLAVSHVGQVYRIQAGTHNGVAGVFISTFVEGEAANPNPPSLDPGLGAKDYLCLACMTHEDSDFGATGAPASYTNLTTTISDSDEDAVLSTARRSLTGVSSEDPGAFTAASEKYQAFTILIEPAGGGGGVTPTGTWYEQGPDTDFWLLGNDTDWYSIADAPTPRVFRRRQETTIRM